MKRNLNHDQIALYKRFDYNCLTNIFILFTSKSPPGVQTERKYGKSDSEFTSCFLSHQEAGCSRHNIFKIPLGKFLGLVIPRGQSVSGHVVQAFASDTSPKWIDR